MRPKQKEIEKLTKYIFIESEDKNADLIFVFGTKSYNYPLDKVLDLYKKNYFFRRNQ